MSSRVLLPVTGKLFRMILAVLLVTMMLPSVALASEEESTQTDAEGLHSQLGYDFAPDLRGGFLSVVDAAPVNAPSVGAVVCNPATVFAGDSVKITADVQSEYPIERCGIDYVVPSGGHRVLWLEQLSDNRFGIEMVTSNKDIGDWIFVEIEVVDSMGNSRRICNIDCGLGSIEERDFSPAEFSVIPSQGPFDISDAEVVLEMRSWNYSGFPICPKPEIWFEDKLLEEGVDYSLSYEDNVDIGEATLIITGLGKFYGGCDKSFSIIEKRSVSVPSGESFQYTGDEITAFENGTGNTGWILVNGSADRATSAGNYEAIFRLSDSENDIWEDGTSSDKIVAWEIVPASFENVDVSGIGAAYTYSGSPIEPSPACVFNGKTLALGEDYDVAYEGNTEVGTARITITGKGNFSGSVEKSFAIEPDAKNNDPAISSNRKQLADSIDAKSASGDSKVSYGNLSTNGYRYTFTNYPNGFSASYTVKDSGWTKSFALHYDYLSDIVSTNFQQVQSSSRYYAASAFFFASDYRMPSDILFNDDSGMGSSSVIYAGKFADIAIPKINSKMMSSLGGSLCKIGFTSYSHSHTGGIATCIEKTQCDVCGQEYGDYGDHSGGEASCIQKAICEICGQEYGRFASHSIELVGEKSNSFTENGYTGDQICSVCGYIDHRGSIIPMKQRPNSDDVEGVVGNWIVDNGIYDDEGNPYIASTTTPNGTKCVGKITYDGDARRLEFWFGSYSGSDAVILSMHVEGGTAYVDFSFAARGAGSFQASSSLRCASYTENSNVYFSLVDSSVRVNEDDIQDLCNSFLKAAFPGWDITLLSTIGLYANMANLGFTSYETPGYGIRDLSGATIALASKVYVYDGQEHRPAVRVEYDGHELIEGTDYEVEYSNNADIGWGTATAKGIGFYEGSISDSFTINPYGTWQRSGGRWWYEHFDGSYTANGWELVDGSWYHFDSSGWMQTGWLNSGGAWYYLSGSGAMVAGWDRIGGVWYWFDASGAMATGWRLVDAAYYFFDGSGAMRTGWLNQGGTWYYLDGSGAMAVGWRSIGGTWYRFDDSGAMKTGWYEVDGDWYCSDGSGAMQSGKWVGDYYLTDSGAMATDQWIGVYHVGGDGKWDMTA